MQHVKSILTQEKLMIRYALVLILLYSLPLIVLGDNAHIRVHDNLDSNIAWYKVLIRSNELFGSMNATIPQVINGLPRGVFGTEFSGIVWLHALFPTMVAYTLSQMITRLFAFIGMHLLLKKHFIKGADTSLIRVGVSLAFALTPFWPSGMLSTLGQPLAFWAFLNIRNRERSWKSWLVLLLLPFYSSFVLGFFFFLTAMGLLWLKDVIKKRVWNPLFACSIALMTLIYLAIEYRLVFGLVLSEAPNSRMEFVNSTLGFWHSVYLAFVNFIFGHGHVLTIHTLVILPILFIALQVAMKRQNRQENSQFIWLLILNFVLSVWYAFWYYKGWEPLKEQFTLLNTFNFARFHFLRPLVIYLGFALGLHILWKKSENWQKRVRICIALQIIILFFCNDEIVYRVYGEPTVKQFYSVDLFQQIKNYIGQPKQSYRVASIGIHPAIAQYNGFYTLDTYNNYYPLTYKHEFRQIIAKELDKSPALRTYFDTWGGRCYLFVSELGQNYEFKKNSTTRIHHLELNMEVFKKMGGRYIFSAVPILNAEEDGLRLLKVFDNSESAWRIYLYQAK
ncbi:DUF6044 family protein [Paenibacillus sp. OV219]|uniref:DUF6044 family protein n=1 Tax=Paenibacillus sp. OV219 TaxID=1884377 RepID=UPI0008D71E89|nr:DUF6044 family protein [Paenibacillus sp. OV219]SEM54395.1 hypothetical protein SAMN05518847_101112 [Paenibacillus sp. OV219]